VGGVERRKVASLRSEKATGNNLFNRRTLLRGGLMAAGVAAQGIADDVPASGQSISPYGLPSKWQKDVRRSLAREAGHDGAGTWLTPLHLLEGTITPNGLHYENHHHGIPDIDPHRHELVIQGMVTRPLVLTLETLMRYPTETHIHFVECPGNSAAFSQAQPRQATAGELNGMISCAEWTGVRLATLLREAGIAREAKWVVAEGADAPWRQRVPLEKCLDDAMIALYQNGEAVRTEQGYPMRLLVPGFLAPMNVKWLRRLEVVGEQSANAKDKATSSNESMLDSKASQSRFLQVVKSAIIKPSFGMGLKAHAPYEISGLAWSGAGRIAKVEISVDGGRNWVLAALGEPVLPKAFTRFRMPWQWNGQPTILMSRATDETGDVQPARSDWIAHHAPARHFNCIQCWSVEADGAVKNIYV
jgi:sulfane dehydrogenase subunit SoxC